MKLKKNNYLSLFLLGAASCLAFTYSALNYKTENIPVSRFDGVLYSHDLGENGFVVKTGTTLDQKRSATSVISYFSSNLDLIWQTEIKSKQAVMDNEIRRNLVTTPDGSYVYSIESLWGLTAKSEKAVYTQINKKGEVREETLPNWGTKGQLSNMFCNDESLCKLVLIEDKKNENNVTFYLQTLSHKDFKTKEYEINLPEVDDSKYNTRWIYLGFKDNYIYFYRATFDEDRSFADYEIEVVNTRGEQVGGFSIPLEIGDYGMLPSLDKTQDFFSIKKYDDSYYTYYKAENTGYFLTNISNGHLKMNPNDNSIYAFGLYGNKGKISYSNAEGYYLKRYDLDGKLIWENQLKFAAPFDIKSRFATTGSFYQRCCNLNMWSEGTIKLDFWFKKTKYSIEFDSQTGEKIDDFSKEYKKAISTREFNVYTSRHKTPTFSNKYKSGAKDYLATREKALKSSYFDYIRNSKGEILIEIESSKKEARAMFFPKE